MMKISTILAKGLLTLTALVVTGGAGYATASGTEKIETVEYTVEQHDSLNLQYKGVYGDGYKYGSLDDFLALSLGNSFNKKMYVKGYDGEIALSADNEFALGDFYTVYVYVYTYDKKDHTVYCLGKLETNGFNRPIAKSDGMIFVPMHDANGNLYYERYGVTDDGKHFTNYGSVSAKNRDPKPIALRKSNDKR